MLLAVELSDGISVGELIVGVGTLTLALFTAWLGFETRASARAARAAVEASEEPFVIATPTDRADLMRLRRPHEFPPQGGTLPPFEIHRATDDDGTHFVRLKLWNIGSGPAIVRDVRLTRDREFLDGLDRFRPVGAGQAADIEIGSSAWPTASRAATLTLDYTRANGLAYRTKMDVTVEGDVVQTITYRRERLRRDERALKGTRPSFS